MRRDSLKSLRPLTTLRPSEVAAVAKLKLPEAETYRLGELGLRRGAAVRVLQGRTDESILLAVGDSRIGVNFETASQIFVF